MYMIVQANCVPPNAKSHISYIAWSSLHALIDYTTNCTDTKFTEFDAKFETRQKITDRN